MHYRAQPIFKGRVVCIIAGGPSLSLPQVRLVGIARAKDLVRVIAINDAVYPAWFSDIAYCCDRAFWQYHNGFPGFSGLKLSLDDCGVNGVDHLTNTGTEGFDPDPGSLRTGGNSGYQALHLCAHLAAKRVLLLGFDMRGSHWFGDHPAPIRRAAPSMQNRIRRFPALVEPMRKRGIEILNVTPNSALDVFPPSSLERELDRAEREHGKVKHAV